MLYKKLWIVLESLLRRNEPRFSIQGRLFPENKTRASDFHVEKNDNSIKITDQNWKNEKKNYQNKKKNE